MLEPDEGVITVISGSIPSTIEKPDEVSEETRPTISNVSIRILALSVTTLGATQLYPKTFDSTESIKTKESLYDDWKETCTLEDPEGNRELHAKYSAYRYTLKHIIKYAKNKFYGKKLEEHKGDSKKTWRIINQLRGKTKRSMKPQFIVDNERIVER